MQKKYSCRYPGCPHPKQWTSTSGRNYHEKNYHGELYPKYLLSLGTKNSPDVQTDIGAQTSEKEGEEKDTKGSSNNLGAEDLGLLEKTGLEEGVEDAEGAEGEQDNQVKIEEVEFNMDKENKDEEVEFNYECGECGEEFNEKSNYCPGCGKKFGV